MVRSSRRKSPLVVLICALSFLINATGCVDESSTPIVFDQELESVSFDNRLYTPITIYRDNVIIDTLPAGTKRTYAIGRKGIVEHSWQILPPRSPLGNPLGIAPKIDLGIQYDIAAEHTIRNSSVSGRTIFTPRIANFSAWDLQLFTNYRVRDEFLTELIVPSNGITSNEHAPYFYWNSNSNIYLDRVSGVGSYRFSRNDTGSSALRLDTDNALSRDAGITIPISIR